MDVFGFNLSLLPIAQQAQGSPFGGWESLLPILLIFVVFYFLLIRPQNKKQKELQKMRDNLQKGDKVLSNGGIYGTVLSLKGNKVVVQVDDDTKLLFSKSALTPAAEPAETPDSAKESKEKK